ncbi:MAG: TauD/TfdA family dioxygenase [Rubrivivax sp.]|nr:TauD/TfdA family dioxygenase [Burkholderiales bacterium]MCW5633496.1 TauD/TfdA family dioxygenase [Rubrivivax sp.]
MPIQVRPLSYGIGAEISGVDLGRPVDDATRAAIRQAWLDHLVIVFRGQDLPPPRQIAFGRMFGELDDHKSVPFYRHPEHPEIYLITNKKIGGKESQTKDTGRLWHSDHSFTTHPTMATMLYCLEIPPVGGTTMVCNMYRAYETLSPALRAVLDKLDAVHSLEHYSAHNPYFTSRDPEQIRKMNELSPPVAQPVVRVHPETGRKALYISEGQTQRFVGMSQAESAGLLQYLFEHSVKPEFTYRHAWKVNDMLMWDNRCTNHLAVPDYSHQTTRHMHRLTVLGTPSGRLLEPQER